MRRCGVWNTQKVDWEGDKDWTLKRSNNKKIWDIELNREFTNKVESFDTAIEPKLTLYFVVKD